MPRRRKRNVSGSTQLRPLLFTESPVNIVNNALSPVFSSDNPVTAEVVPIDGNTAIPWVSPQFVKAPASVHGKGRRYRRSQRPTESLHTTRPRTRSTAHETNGLPCHNASDKYTPLNFILLGETSNSPEQQPCVTEDSSVQRNTRPQKNDLCGASENEVGHNMPTENSTSSLNQEVGCPEINTSLAMLAEPQTTAISRNTDSSQEYLQPTHVLVEPHPNVEDPGVACTQQRSPSALRHGRPNRRLFRSRTDQSLEQDSNRTVVNLCDSFEAIPQRKSSRLKKCKENLFSDVMLSQSPQHNTEALRVLVYDTPEEQYGMSARERRLLRTNNHTKVKRK